MNYLRRSSFPVSSPLRFATSISNHSSDRGTRYFTSKNNSKLAANGGNKGSSRPSSASQQHHQQQPPTQPKVGFSVAYIHPLSQLVLQNLQQKYHSWISVHGMDSLRLHPDGTFVLGNDAVQVWTYFDTQDLKHWLAVLVHGQQTGVFLLQDNGGRQHGYKKAASTPERVHECVQSLVESVDEKLGSL